MHNEGKGYSRLFLTRILIVEKPALADVFRESPTHAGTFEHTAAIMPTLSLV